MFIRVCCLVKTETLATGICHSEEAGIWFIGVCRLVKTETLSAGICHSEEAGIRFGWISDDRQSFLFAQNLFRQFFPFSFPFPRARTFLRAVKNYKPVSYFCGNGRTFISTLPARLFPKAEMSGLFPSDNWSAKRRPSPPAVLSVPDSPVFQKTDGR